MNCPNCEVGIMELIGYIPLKAGPLELVFDRFPPHDAPALTVSLCSREPCEHAAIGAAPKSLSLAKRLLRDSAMTR